MNIPKFDENGNHILNESYKEILALDKMLTDANIPHDLDRFLDGWQICYPAKRYNCIIMDAIEHFGSYGNEADKLEIMGLLTPEEKEHDSVLGWQSAQEVFDRINAHYQKCYDQLTGFEKED